jgi:hypothetical protein
MEREQARPDFTSYQHRIPVIRIEYVNINNRVVNEMAPVSAAYPVNPDHGSGKVASWHRRYKSNGPGKVLT